MNKINTSKPMMSKGQLLYVTSYKSMHKGELAVFIKETNLIDMTNIIKVLPAHVIFDETTQEFKINTNEEFYNLRNDSIRPATEFDIIRTLPDDLLKKLIMPNTIESLKMLRTKTSTSTNLDQNLQEVEFAILHEIGNLQNAYRDLQQHGNCSKQNICNLVIPFRDKYNLTDLQALQIARNEISLSKMAEYLKQE